MRSGPAAGRGPGWAWSPHTGTVTTEIERKFLVTAPPVSDWEAGEELRQGYLVDDGRLSVRVRIAPSSATLTVKAGEGLARTEVTAAITAAEAHALWPLTDGRRIHKHRVRLPLPDGLVAEVDRYHGDLDGLHTVEVEFTDEAAAAAFVPPPWFGEELTHENRWTNAALARHGRPEGAPG